MNLSTLELKVHQLLTKYPNMRHSIYGIYQKLWYLISPKFKYEGDISKVSPEDDKEYFFGYYDKSPWDSSGRYLICLRVKDTKKSVAPKEPADIMLIDTNDYSHKAIAQSNSWNVQQGCMLQWMGPDYDKKIIYNDFRNGKYCSVILDITTLEETVQSMPVYSVSTDGKTALTLDFSRLHRLRPGYGYSNKEDSTLGNPCPETTCIWRVNLDKGTNEAVLNYTDLFNFEQRPDMVGAEHKVNHIMINPSGDRFMVLHRWLKDDIKYTRLLTCNLDGSDLFNLSDDNFTSHCTWKNDQQILSYLNKESKGKGYYILEDKTNNYKRLWDELLMDGHPSYSPDNKEVITDTYPNRRRIQTLYHIKRGEVKILAKFFSPFKYSGNFRCDLHPRWSRDGEKVSIDATYEGVRRMYIINL